MVKQGYKQTEIGVIPEEWEVKELKYIAPLQRGFDLPYSDMKAGPYPVVFSNGIGAYHSKYIVKSPGVVTGRSGTIGKVHFIDKDFWPHNTSLWVTDFFGNNELYIFYLLNTINWNLYNSGSGVPTLNRNDVHDVKRALPPYHEQKQIAKALSNVDGMISSLDKLIAKKKDVKHGTMQELLTGKRRLHGFTEKWKLYKLDELLKYEQPTRYIVHNADYVSHGTPVLTAGKSLVLGYTNESDGIYNNLPVIIFDDFITSSKYITYKFKVKSSAMKMLTLKKPNMNLRLIFELMQMIDFKPIDHQRHWISQYSQFEVALPASFKEQNAIVSILSDIDSEIEALEQKLAKAQQIKQGMMQQLLTGKIRLVAEDRANAANPATKNTGMPHAKSGHNQQFDDAVIIAAIVNAFYSEKYPLGRKKVQKLLYLLRRRQEENTSAFKKKAAGPYADEIRYKGGEPIARKQGYIVTSTTSKGTIFSKGNKINAALNYVEKWQIQPDIDWLVSTFKYTNINDLELFATIDMAICDLQRDDVVVSVDSIKDLIRSNEEWKAKLTKTYFSDADIARAIAMCKKIYS